MLISPQAAAGSLFVSSCVNEVQLRSARVQLTCSRLCGCARLQGNTQGPCSILQFKKWLLAMTGKQHLQAEYQKFKDVSVWRVRC